MNFRGHWQYRCREEESQRDHRLAWQSYSSRRHYWWWLGCDLYWWAICSICHCWQSWSIETSVTKERCVSKRRVHHDRGKVRTNSNQLSFWAGPRQDKEMAEECQDNSFSSSCEPCNNRPQAPRAVERFDLRACMILHKELGIRCLVACTDS